MFPGTSEKQNIYDVSALRKRAVETWRIAGFVYSTDNIKITVVVEHYRDPKNYLHLIPVLVYGKDNKIPACYRKQ